MHMSRLLECPLILSGGDRIGDEVWDVAIHPVKKKVLGILSELETESGRELCFLPTGHLDHNDGRLIANVQAEELTTFSVDHSYGKDQIVPLESLPPVVVGPFGHAVSPAMMAAVLNAQLERAEHGASAPGKGVWFSELNDLPVFDASGEIGHFKDISITTDSFECKALILGSAQGGPFHVPFEALRNIPDDMTHIVIQERNVPF